MNQKYYQRLISGLVFVIVALVLIVLKLATSEPPAMQTRYVGVFPTNMNAINELINQTRTELDVLVDTLPYGHYSNPPGFEEYRNAVQSALNKQVAVRFVTYGDELDRQATQAQIRKKEEDFQKDLKDPRLDAYVRYHKLNRPKSAVEFYDLLDSFQKQYYQELRGRGVPIARIAKEAPVFIWLSDRKRAIVSFYNLDDDEREVSLRTDDPNLIHVLGLIFERMHREATSAKPVGM